MPYRIAHDPYGDETIWYYRTPNDDYPVPLLSGDRIVQNAGGEQLWTMIKNMIHNHNEGDEYGSR